VVTEVVMLNILDKLWLWTHVAGGVNNQYGFKEGSKISPAEAASYMGVSNILFVRLNNKPEVPEYSKYAASFKKLNRVVWSIIGDSASSNESEVPVLLELSKKFPNIRGVIMDDFFSFRMNAYKPQDIANIRRSLSNRTDAGHKLDLWVTLYTHELDLAVKPYLDECDVTTLWTWHSEDLARLEMNFAKLKKMCPGSRKVLGCYMYDFGNSKPMQVELMEKQCRFGLDLLKTGEIEGIIFLASCICDLRLDAVEWTKKWIDSIKSSQG